MGYALEAPTKTKLGHNFHAGLPLSVLSCPPRHLFSSPFNHCLFTLSQELNEPRLRALPGKLWRPHPALPSTTHSLAPSPSLFHTASPNNPTPAHSTLPHKRIQSHRAATSSPFHTHPSTKAMGECVISLCFLSYRYRGLLWLDHPTIGGTISCSQGRLAAHGSCQQL